MMVGTLFGELCGLCCVCLSSVSCTVIDVMCLYSGFPSQPTPDPHVLQEHSKFTLKALHHLLQVQA